MEPVRFADGRMLRYFALPDSSGQSIDLEKYQRERSLVIFFGHEGCPRCAALLADYAGRAAVVRDEGAEPVAVLNGANESAERSASQLPVLIDAGGSAARAQGLQAPALLITDVYGEIYVAWEGGESHDLPSGEDIVDWVVSIERLCEECTVSEWSLRGEEND